MATQKRVRELLEEVYNQGYNQAIQDIFGVDLFGGVMGLIVIISIILWMVSFIKRPFNTFNDAIVIGLITIISIIFYIAYIVRKLLKKHELNILVLDKNSFFDECSQELTDKNRVKAIKVKVQKESSNDKE
jgi:Mg2+/Co2+ transporter CorC